MPLLTRYSRLALLPLLAAGATTQVWAEIKFEPSISVGATYVDNINLVPPGVAKTSDVVGQLVPRLVWEQQGPRLTSAIDYSAQSLFFRDRSDLNATYHNGQANAAWIAAPNLFFVDGWASYSQQTIDPTQPRNVDNLFGVSNIANEFNVMLSPYLRRDFGDITALMRYSAATSKYSGVSGSNVPGSLQNSFTSAVTAQLATDDKGAHLAWSLDGRTARTTFDSAQPFRDDRVAAEGSIGVAQSLRLIASAGAETNILKNSSDGGLDAGFWSVGFKWAPSARGSLEARAGHRFFGNAYSLSWTRESRLLVFRANYSEEPTTTGQSDGLASFVPGATGISPQAYTNVLRSSTTYSPYLRKEFDASIELRGRRTQIVARVYRMRREYFDLLLLGNTDTTSGGAFTFTRDLSDRSTIGLNATIDVVAQLNGFDYRDRRYALEYGHKLGQTLTISLQGVHLERTGDSEYRANVGQLTLKKAF